MVEPILAALKIEYRLNYESLENYIAAYEETLQTYV